MRRKSRKGQVKMFESIAVLIIFFFLLSFGFTFYGKMQGISNMKKIRKAIEIDAVSLTIRTSNLPELQCSVKNVNEPNCYDELKLKAFRQLLQNVEENSIINDYYYQVFGYSKIELEIIYPPSEKTRYLLYDRMRVETEEEVRGTVTLMPITIYHPVNKIYKFAYLNITYYPPE